MRTAILTLALIAIASTLALGASVEDPRLSQKVTYRVRLRPIADLTEDLSKLTHVTFRAGQSNSDWRVREDCTTVIAKDVPLATLMDSIAHALKFRWVRSGSAPNWSYRLTEDPAAIAALTRRKAAKEKQLVEYRRRWLVTARAFDTLSAKELADVRQNEPYLYQLGKGGSLQPMLDLFQQVPEVEDAFLSGKELKLSPGWLSPQQRKAALNLALALMKADARVTAPGEQFDSGQAIAILEKDYDGLTITVDEFTLSVEGCQTLLPVDTELFKLGAMVLVRALDENRSYRETEKETKEQIRALSRKDYEEFVGSEVGVNSSENKEPRLNHPPDPALAQPLSAKVDHRAVSWTIAALSDASGFAIVTDDLRGRTELAFEKGSLTRGALDRLSAARQTNWNRNGRVIEVWQKYWYDKRECRVSKAWLAAIRKRLEENGTYDIDDLVEIASLTKDQYCGAWRDIYADTTGYIPDDALSCLRIYGSLDTGQRSALFSSSGIYFSDLSPEQQQSMLSVIKCQPAEGIPGLDFAALRARIVASKERRGKHYNYTFQAYTKLGPIPGKLVLRTPVYTPPQPDPPKDTPAGPQPAPANDAK